MSSKVSRLLVRSLIGVSALVVAFFLALTVTFMGPALEAKFFPVATKLRVERMESHPLGTIIETASFTKLRDCTFAGLAWYRKDFNGNFIEVSVLPIGIAAFPNGTPINRPLGENQVGPWLIALPLRQVIYGSIGRIKHRCHPFWTTVTDFYP